MVLRVEDTDVARSTKESEDAILEGLKWCGITWDEGPDVGGNHGPYRQSERIEAGIYKEQLEKLIAGGHAYRCFLSPEELDEMRAEAERNDQAFVLQSPWANASEEEVQAMIDQGKPYVYRFRVPFDREIVIDDLVLGEVIWNSDDLGGDFVIVRQNGMPMYNFGVVVDDASMHITHVLRAQEHLMNTPRQFLMYEALGLKVPTFAHMPLILAPDRTKLSKRHGAVSVGEYQKRGYLPSGMVNYLAQLGWNDGTKQEIYTLEELMSAFRMNRMSKVAAIFDADKFKWVNGHHVRRLTDDEALSLIGNELKDHGLVKEVSGPFVQKASQLLRDRISTLTEAVQELEAMLHFDLEGMKSSDVAKPYIEDGSLLETAKLLLKFKDEGDFDAVGTDPKAIQKVAKKMSEARGGVKKKALLVPLRLCLTSAASGPDMNIFFEMIKEADDNVLCKSVSLEERLDLLSKPAVCEDGLEIARVYLATWGAHSHDLLRNGNGKEEDSKQDLQSDEALRAQSQRFTDFITTGKRLFIVAELREPAGTDKLCAFISYGPSYARQGFGEVMQLFVHPNFQRKGLGTRLLMAAWTQMRSKEWASLGCHVWCTKSNPANRVYEQAGWFQTGKEKCLHPTLGKEPVEVEEYEAPAVVPSAQSRLSAFLQALLPCCQFCSCCKAVNGRNATIS
ncbi:unnamed protein product [Effrenium voratum]|nr:unnamed protein product [Effrenium voratum]